MLFKESRTAMIINGPWSRAGYHVPEQNMIAPLPYNSETGHWCETMILAKGYSVSVNVPSSKLAAIRELVSYLTGTDVQEKMAHELSTTPTDKTALASPEIQHNPALLASMQQ